MGAKEAGGRWNSPGTSMVYTSETASLTMLETLVHLRAPQILDWFTLLRVNVPDKLIMSTDMSVLPGSWNSEEAPAELAAYGDNWAESQGSVALRVPSALSPVEYNYVLNPEHPAYHGIIREAKEIPFRFDSRLRLQLR